MDIVRLDRTAKLETVIKRNKFVALIFSDIAIYLIAAYSLGQTRLTRGLFFEEINEAISAPSSRAFRELFHAAKNSKVKTLHSTRVLSSLTHSLSLSLCLFHSCHRSCERARREEFCSTLSYFVYDTCRRPFALPSRSPIKEIIKRRSRISRMEIPILY